MSDEFVFVESSCIDDFEDKVKELLLCNKVISAREINEITAELTLDNGTVLRFEGSEGITNCAEGWCFLDTVCECPDTITDVKYEMSGDPDVVKYQIFAFSGEKKIQLLEYSGYESGYFGTDCSLYVKHCEGAS